MSGDEGEAYEGSFCEAADNEGARLAAADREQDEKTADVDVWEAEVDRLYDFLKARFGDEAILENESTVGAAIRLLERLYDAERDEKRWSEKVREMWAKHNFALDVLRGDFDPPTIEEIRRARGLEPLSTERR